ncbi:uncharacterized protein [Coffea arabica]|uniref:HMA domain-containing protein n=1 Tax=Coffea arabica TaxID=13443 RepID=A0A6P6VFA2_COFAR|nr:uncharacterized protein LOC113721452 [Coffea arabica]
MENPSTEPTILLKMNINCCEFCPGRLERALLTIDGVLSVAVYREKNLVAVKGKVDPNKLIASIKAWGKTAKFLGYDGGPMNFNNHADKEKPQSSKPVRDKCPEHKNFPKNGKERNRGYPKDEGRKKEESSHEPEAYVAPQIDREVCRDPYCKLHKSRPIFHNKVPSIDCADHPHHTGGYFPRGGSGSHFLNHGNASPYDYPRMAPHPMMEQPGYGFYSGSYYGPRFDDYSYHDDAPYPRHWPYM